LVAARSTVLAEVARAVCSSAGDFSATYKKLYRRLSEVDLRAAMEQLQARALRELTDEHIIALDIGDLAKPESETLEGLQLVADGSRDHRLTPGYWLIGAVAVNSRIEDKTPQPLLLELFSAASEGFCSENTIVREAIEHIYHRASGRGTFTIDRGGDRGRILTPLLELKARFIVRLSDRHVNDLDSGDKLAIGRRSLTRQDVPHEIIIEPRHKNGKRVPMRLRVDFRRVAVTALAKKVPHECYLVTAWSATASAPMELLTSLPVHDLATATDVVIGYLSRLSVEETDRFLKASHGLESIQLRGLGKIENLIHGVFLAVSILARSLRSQSWRKTFARHTAQQKEAPDSLYNWLYRATEVAARMLKLHLAALHRLNATVFHNRRQTGINILLFPTETWL
jgi:Transposase DDE domain